MNNKEKNNITIFTPTYNRKELLLRLYNSISKQNYKNIRWLIVDDGSTDDTEILINNLKKENLIIINYFKQNNLGKYKAFNKAIDMCKTEYFICIDSDDYLCNENSLQTIIDDLNKNIDKYVGIIYPWKKNIENKKVLKLVDAGIDIQDIKNLFNILFESTIIFKTEFLKKFKFKENEEKFMSEEILYNEMSRFGKFLLKNEVVVSGEYHDDGLTKNIFKLWLNNYNNTILLFKSRYDFLKKYKFKIKIINRAKCIINCNVVNMIKHESINNSPNIISSYLLYIPSVLYYFKKRGSL